MNASKQRYVGLDFGMARIGIAISDERNVIAAPYRVLKTEKKTETTIARLLEALEEHKKEYRYDIAAIVVGMPLLMSGKKGFLADEVRHFIEKLQAATTIPIIARDERLTSVQAERSLREGSLSRKRRSQLVDTVAAVLILQNFLDNINLNQEHL